MELAQLNALDEEAAAAAFLRCCGSSRWARRMTAARPFARAAAVSASADAIWRGLDRADWLEAFAAHPKIGAGRAGRAGRASGSGTTKWSRQEQSRVADADASTLRRLDEGNRAYEARFGYIFIVCAAGRTAGEMLALLERRLRHDADVELPVAGEEQRKITRLRLAKLIEPGRDTTT